jgi:hypothetical protein
MSRILQLSSFSPKPILLIPISPAQAWREIEPELSVACGSKLLSAPAYSPLPHRSASQITTTSAHGISKAVAIAEKNSIAYIEATSKSRVTNAQSAIHFRDVFVV